MLVSGLIIAMYLYAIQPFLMKVNKKDLVLY
jgi:hypothetical protein